MNDNTTANDTFTIPMEVLDGSTGELKETIEFTFTREDIRNAVKEMKEHERIAAETGFDFSDHSRLSFPDLPSVI